MLEATFATGGVFKELVSTVNELVDHVAFEATAEAGLYLQAMDNSHVSLISVKLEPDGFSHFRCDKPTRLCVHLGNLSKLLKAVGSGDRLTLSCEDENPDVLHIASVAEDNDRFSEFDLNMLSIESEEMGIPEFEHSAEAEMSSREFQRVIKSLAAIGGDTVSVGVDVEGVMFKCSGDVGTGRMRIRSSEGGPRRTSQNKKGKKKEEEDLTAHVHVTEPVELKFSAKMMVSFAKAASLAPTVLLCLTDQLPIALKYRLGDDMGLVTFYLAPRIDDDEEEGQGAGGAVAVGAAGGG